MKRLNKWLQIVLATLMGATFFVGESCASTVARNVNPCGTIIDCDPFEYDQLFVDHTRSNWELDPTCTVPGYCDGVTPWPPAGAGSVGQTNQTGQTGQTTGQ